MTFNRVTQLDPAYLKLAANELHRVFDGPTVLDLRIPGQNPLFVSTLLHGNETSGWEAVRYFLREQTDRSIVVFIGNLQSAKLNVRHLDGELDFNRVWAAHPWNSALSQLLKEVDPWCAVDIHNNSGPNPHYSVLTDQKPATLNLAKQFSDQVIFTQHTLDIFSYAASHHCPSITIETGSIDDPESVTRAYKFIKRLTELGQIDTTSVPDLECFTTVGTLQVTPPTDFEICEFPQFNQSFIGNSFKEFKSGTQVASQVNAGWKVEVECPPASNETTQDFLSVNCDQRYLKRDTIISMFTADPKLALQDCVCYFLKRVELQGG